MSRIPFLTVAGVAAVAGCIALAPPAKESKPAAPPAAAKPAAPAQPDHTMPPGMSEADMLACAAAAAPGPMHEYLAKSIGVWAGKCTMWMTPGAEPAPSECTTTITSMMDGRFTKCETAGEMPGMGPFSGLGIYGFDNVSQKFQSTWIDTCGTGMMTGKGELSPDGTTLTLNCTYNCPITKKPAVMREIERRTGKDSMTYEMYGTDPKSGTEYKVMEIVYTRKPATAAAGSTR